jgi:hypothetical protein
MFIFNRIRIYIKATREKIEAVNTLLGKAGVDFTVLSLIGQQVLVTAQSNGLLTNRKIIRFIYDPREKLLILKFFGENSDLMISSHSLEESKEYPWKGGGRERFSLEIINHAFDTSFP